MAYDNNLKKLEEMAAAGSYNAPGGDEKFKRFLESIGNPDIKLDGVALLREIHNDTIALFDTVALWPKGEVPEWIDEYTDQNVPQFAFFPAKGGGKHGCIIVAPGGGYDVKASSTEGYPIINWLTKEGFHCALLDYRIKPYRTAVSMMDARRCVRKLRYMAEELDIIPDKIGMIGGSAGGNLTCLTGVHYDFGDPNASDPVERISSRLDACIVMYGTMSAVAQGALRLVKRTNDIDEKPPKKPAELGSPYAEGEIRKEQYYYSPEKWITPDTPPFFLWQTCDEDDPRNLFLFAKELADAGVRFEAHIYPFGPHGLGLADGAGQPPERGRNEHVMHWFEQAVEWLRLYGF